MKLTIVHVTGSQINDFRLDVIEVPGAFTALVKKIVPVRNRNYRKDTTTWEVDTEPHGRNVIRELDRLGYTIEIREEQL